jgi:hypothetical protein
MREEGEDILGEDLHIEICEWEWPEAQITADADFLKR